jgi:hypothetical protein
VVARTSHCPQDFVQRPFHSPKCLVELNWHRWGA